MWYNTIWQESIMLHPKCKKRTKNNKRHSAGLIIYVYVSCCIFLKCKYFNTVHFWHLKRPLWMLSAPRSIWVSFVWLSKWGPSVKPREKPRRVSDTRFGSGRTGLNTSSTLLITQVPNEFTADWTYSVGFFFFLMDNWTVTHSSCDPGKASDTLAGTGKGGHY